MVAHSEKPKRAEPHADPGDGPSPFHCGEQAVQQRIGVRERSERGGRRGIRSFMPPGYDEFFDALPFLIVGSLDAEGRPWASWLQGEPGFINAANARSLLVSVKPSASDPLAENLRAGAALGLLGIELETRRRNRVNGRVAWVSEQGFEVKVDQAFGNCKQYIQVRTPTARGASEVRARDAASAEGALLSERAVAILSRADTSFLATASVEPGRGGSEGVDVSHRGGLPGFIRVEHAKQRTRLTLPDYYGNFLFNSLGNIEVYPRAGLLACDFENGDLLSLSGSARIIWDGPELLAFAGAERLLELDVETGVLLRGALGGGWSAPSFAREFGDSAAGA